MKVEILMGFPTIKVGKCKDCTPPQGKCLVCPLEDKKDKPKKGQGNYQYTQSS